MGLLCTPGNCQLNVSDYFPFQLTRPKRSQMISTPFARLRAGCLRPNPTAGHVTKARHPGRPDYRKVKPFLETQAARAAPTPMAGSTKKVAQINPPTRPATATGRMVAHFDCTHACTPCHSRVFATDRGNKNSKTFYEVADGTTPDSRVWTWMLEVTISSLTYDWSVNLYISNAQAPSSKREIWGTGR